MFVSQKNLARHIIVLAIAAMIVSPGCRRKAQVSANRTTITTTTEQTNSFDTAIEFLNNLDQYRPDTVQVQVLSNLRDWSQQDTTAVDWLEDPMLNDLPVELRPSDAADLQETAFKDYDVLDLQEAVWLRDVAKTVSGQPLPDPELQRWLDAATKDGRLTSDQAADLSLTYRLFDWTVRNTQLDDAQDKDDVLATSAGSSEATLRHRYSPWQNLLYGHADWIERARMHILLCRQVGIDCVMLSANRGNNEQAQPWVVAALIGDQLYLFDPLLGLPLPGQGGAPFGTLAEYVQNPNLLDDLVVGPQPYRIATSDLQNLVANIDASLTALSQRMRQIESRLSGKYRMILTSTPTTLAKAWRSSKYLSDFQIWPEPYRGIQFMSKFMADPSAAPALYERLRREQQPFYSRSSLMRGRLLHLRGNYRGDPNNPDEPGANKLYMNSRLSKRELERFSTPLETLRKVAKDSPLLEGLPDDPAEAFAEYERRVAFALENAIWSKDNASIWLAMIAFDKQEFDVAKNHLTRLLENENSRWLQTARYNLARAYEVIGKANGDTAMIEKAIEIYESDESTPQRAGNLLRAKRLRARI